MVIEYARDVLGYKDANSTEMDVNTPHNVIDLMESQKCISNMGGTMRLGEYDCILQEGSKAEQAYGKTHIKERHRHRFDLMAIIVRNLKLPRNEMCGRKSRYALVEVVEVPSLTWYIGVQYHPEYNSTVLNPNPLFLSFIKAIIDHKK